MVCSDNPRLPSTVGKYGKRPELATLMAVVVSHSGCLSVLNEGRGAGGGGGKEKGHHLSINQRDD
jgi:hypothetical protein